MNITLFSFGFKHGSPQADLVWDVRFLPNPHWVEELKAHTGREPMVARYVLENETCARFLALLEPLLVFLLDEYTARGREAVTLAVGCTGGQHRSVALVEYLRGFLEKRGLTPQVYHRDIDKAEGTAGGWGGLGCVSCFHFLSTMEDTMKELLKNMVYAGIGAAFLTKEKIEELQGELIEKGKISKEEGKQLVDDLLRKSEKARDQLDLWVNKRVEERVSQLNLATKDELAELQRKVEELQILLNRGAGE